MSDFGMRKPGGLKWDAGRMPPRVAATDIPCNAIVQLAPGRNWFGITGQAVRTGQKYSTFREGFVELPLPTESGEPFTLADGAMVPVVQGANGFFEIGAHGVSDPEFFVGRACGEVKAGDRNVLVELISFADPS